MNQNQKIIGQIPQNQTKNLRQIKINFNGYVSRIPYQTEVIQIENESQIQAENLLTQTQKMDEQLNMNSTKQKFQDQKRLQQINEILIIDESEQNQISKKLNKNKFCMEIDEDDKGANDNFKMQEKPNKNQSIKSPEQKQLKLLKQFQKTKTFNNIKEISNQTKIDYEIIDLSDHQKQKQKKQNDLNLNNDDKKQIKVNFEQQMNSQESSQSEYFPPSDQSFQNFAYFGGIKRRLRARDLKQISLEQFYGVKVKRQSKKEQNIQKLQNRLETKQQHKIQTEFSQKKRIKKLHRFRNIKRIHKRQKIISNRDNRDREVSKNQKLKQKLHSIFQKRKLQENQITKQNKQTNELMLRSTSNSDKIQMQNKKESSMEIEKKSEPQKEVKPKQDVKISPNLKNKVLETIANNFQFKCMARQMLNLEVDNANKYRNGRSNFQNQYNLDSQEQNREIGNTDPVITIDIDSEEEDIIIGNGNNNNGDQIQDEEDDDIIFQQPNRLKHLLNKKIQVSQTQN